MKKYILILALFVSVMLLHAEITLPALIANNMVLQQKSEVKLWGTANANKTVTVKMSWSNKSYKTLSDSNGSWLLKVQTPSAGGPFTITFSDGQKKTISNVMLGEVWLCSGQSNMEMPVKGYNAQPVDYSLETINQSENSTPIRLFKIDKIKSITPLNNLPGDWQLNNPSSVKDFSAIAYFYALYLQSVLKVPVGIITAAWGGVGIESFMDSISLSQFQKVNTPKQNTSKFTYPMNCELYNAMIFPLRNVTIKGVIWYQGETNAEQSALYRKKFPAMVAKWRNIWKLGDFPFYFAQIAPWKYKAVNGTAAARMREVQQYLAEDVPNAGIVPTIDTGDSLIIHPAAKKLIAERFAHLSLARTYNIKGIEYQAPLFKSMTVNNDTVVLDFKNAELGFHTNSKKIQSFEIAGSDSIFKPARAMITDKATKIRLTEPSIKTPIAVRYAFKNFAPASLFNNLGYPLMPFRTDDWKEKKEMK
ncbi:MAG: sialate O-acetylesterase [Sulfuricurvum sp.]|nr:sialate O-acetylesterase [Sulfuricurvum sp.]